MSEYKDLSGFNSNEETKTSSSGHQKYYEAIRIVFEDYAQSQPKTDKVKNTRPSPERIADDYFGAIFGTGTTREKETEKMRSKFKDVGPEVAEIMYEKIKNLRTRVLESSQSQKTAVLDLNNCDWYNLSTNIGNDKISFTTEDTPNDIDSILSDEFDPENQLVFGFSIKHQDGNGCNFNFFADSSVIFDIELSPIDEGQATLRYEKTSSSIPLDELKGYEIDMINYYLDLFPNNTF
jgi:hypothetical protein